MAKLKLAPYLQAISGRMGGVVYRSTKFGTEMAEFDAPSNPSTAAQQAVRNSFKKAAQQWRTLTVNQAAQWRFWATSQLYDEEITEKRYRTTGFNAFVKLAAKWYAVNATGTAPATPPATAFTGDNVTITFESETPGVIQVTASAVNSATVTTALLVQKVSSPNSDPVDGAYKIAKYNKFTTGAGLTTTIALAPGYYAVGYQFVNTATGQTSTPVLQANIVGPVTFAVTGASSNKKAA